MFNKESAALIGAGVLSIISMSVALHTAKENKKVLEEKNSLEAMLREKINMGVDEVIRKDSIDISQAVVNAAIDKAAQNAIDKYGYEAAREAEQKCIKEINGLAEKAILSLKSDIKPKVKESLQKKADNISIDDIKKEIVESATKEAEMKIQAEMDAILLKHQQQLDAINNIYNNIGAAVKGGNNVIQVEA